MTFTFAAAVAWDSSGNKPVKNASFQVYATSDTGFTTPLPITDTFGNSIPGNILNSGSQGVFPQFNQASNSAVVITDPAHTYAWTINAVMQDASVAAYINSAGSATQTALNATYAGKPDNGAKAVGKGELVINAKDYGAKGDGLADDTSAITSTIAAVVAAGGGVVYLPAGTYLASTVTMKDKVTLRGAGPEVTVLRAKTGSAAPGLIQIAAGPVQYMNIQDMQIRGADTAGQSGIYALSVGDGGTPNHGGWWSGGMRNVRIVNFSGGNSIWLRAVGSAGLTPHQYLVFDHVETWNMGTNEAILISGQCGQIAFINGFFCGPNMDNGTTASVRIARELGDNRSTVISDSSPYAVTFLQSSFQSNAIGLLVERSMSVTLDGPHFETCGIAAKVDVSGAVSITGANVQNSGHNTAGTGIAFQAVNAATLNASGTSFFGTTDKHFSGYVRAVNSNYTDPLSKGPVSSGVTVQTSVQADNTLPLGAGTTFLINASATPIKTIQSWKAPGESVFLRAFSGSIIFDYGGTAPGNIDPSGLVFPLTVPSNAIVHLVKMDLANNWCIVSVTK